MQMRAGLGARLDYKAKIINIYIKKRKSKEIKPLDPEPPSYSLKKIVPE